MVELAKPLIDFDDLFSDGVIMELCLADKIWNAIGFAGGTRMQTCYIRMQFREHRPELIRSAIRQLIAEGRAELTPGGKYLRRNWVPPPGRKN